MTYAEGEFLKMCNDTIDIVRIESTKDTSGGPVAAPGTVAYAGLKCSRQPHRSKLHGNQVEEWSQPVTHAHVDVYVLGIYPDLGPQANGYGVVFGSDGVFLRITNVEPYIAPAAFAGRAPTHSQFICEEVSP